MKPITGDKAAALRDLRRIPGVGPSIAEDLWALGYASVTQLRGENPELMYERHCVQKGMRVDRCVLYIFRCAVYFASEPSPESEKLKWWNWKD